MTAYEKLASMALEIEGVEFERLDQPVSEEFTRVTTVMHLHGRGVTGHGEDVCYEPSEHDPLLENGLAVDVRGRWRFDELSRCLDVDLFPGQAPEFPMSRAFRRWALESAALDLALRQSEQTLGDALGRPARPVRFVASMQLDPPTSTARLHDLRDRVPAVRFKLDARSEWDDQLVEEIAVIGGVDIVDLKGMYEGTIVDQPADPALYRRVAAAFPDALLEDPNLTDEARDALGADGLSRVSWDAPIQSSRDPFGQRCAAAAVNVKPSRIGSVRELLATYEELAQAGIPMYGGGQMELGPGRGQIQLLASLFHPDGPNDVAPREYNLPSLPEHLRSSPIPLVPGPGFSADS